MEIILKFDDVGDLITYALRSVDADFIWDAKEHLDEKNKTLNYFAYDRCCTALEFPTDSINKDTDYVFEKKYNEEVYKELCREIDKARDTKGGFESLVTRYTKGILYYDEWILIAKSIDKEYELKRGKDENEARYYVLGWSRYDNCVFCKSYDGDGELEVLEAFLKDIKDPKIKGYKPFFGTRVIYIQPSDVQMHMKKLDNEYRND